MTKYGFFEILTYSSIHEPLWGILNVFTWGLVTGLTFQPIIYFFTFSVLFLIYAYNRIADIKEDKISASERLTFIKKIKSINVYAAIVLFIISCALIFLTGNLTALSLYLLTGFIGINYSKKILFIPKIKNILLIKNISIGVMFALSVIAVPFLLVGADMTGVFYLLLAYLFLRVFINTIYFDIRDIAGDKTAGVLTIPIKIGEQKTIKILNIINALTLLIILPILNASPNPHYILFVLPAILGAIYLNLPKNTFKKMTQYELIADGTDSYLYILIFAIIWLVALF
ncbi:MAG: UbiA family prenyltransferase [Candidatus Firestonebacteria bacterium]